MAAGRWLGPCVLAQGLAALVNSSRPGGVAAHVVAGKDGGFGGGAPTLYKSLVLKVAEDFARKSGVGHPAQRPDAPRKLTPNALLRSTVEVGTTAAAFVGGRIDGWYGDTRIDGRYGYGVWSRCGCGGGGWGGESAAAVGLGLERSRARRTRGRDRGSLEMDRRTRETQMSPTRRHRRTVPRRRRPAHLPRMPRTSVCLGGSATTPTGSRARFQYTPSWTTGAGISRRWLRGGGWVRACWRRVSRRS